jgi:hypothetical protein
MWRKPLMALEKCGKRYYQLAAPHNFASFLLRLLLHCKERMENEGQPS